MKTQKILRLECLSLWRQPADFLLPIAFFLIVVCLFPITMSGDPNQLQQFGPGVIWVAAMLAMLLGIHTLFLKEFREGRLEQWWFSEVSIIVRILMRVMIHWALTLGPMMLLLPVIGIFYHLPVDCLMALFLGLLVGSPILWLLGSVISSLTLDLSQSHVLISLLLLPLSIPVMIFGLGLVRNVSGGLSIAGPLAMLAGLLLISLYCTPVAIKMALRLAVEES